MLYIKCYTWLRQLLYGKLQISCDILATIGTKAVICLIAPMSLLITRSSCFYQLMHIISQLGNQGSAH